MSTDVILPKWGLTMEDGTVVAWYVDEGDHVVEGEVTAEVATRLARLLPAKPSSTRAGTSKRSRPT